MSDLREVVGGPLDGAMREPMLCPHHEGEVMSLIERVMDPDGRHVQVHIYDWDYEAEKWYWDSNFERVELAVVLLVTPRREEEE